MPAALGGAGRRPVGGAVPGGGGGGRGAGGLTAGACAELAGAVERLWMADQEEERAGDRG